ncbi:MAG: glycosyltransferase, exosortase A system-associated [Gammaproteobacteria bacterium]|nr:glycosyltransferase, exosortase A system-associated [Gammaproteobacteria bacterium]MDH5593183.1 glycosyltransferase, exosortase A system-associated [Gammaproteobacteria bacterium]MDH5614176.1 glycosyltransferase, exosortase A system-associated [Gammaproteobacteria bacterium]
MRILHILDHSIPLHSGYTFRTRAILEQQRKMGWETFHVTSPKHGFAANYKGLEEQVGEYHFFRTPSSGKWYAKLPVISQWAIIQDLKVRLEQVIEDIKPDILHAHSPAINGLAAHACAKKFNLPLVYEVRAFWEDAAVDHGTSSEWGWRYRLTRYLETHVLKSADAVTTICNGLRNDIINRNILSEKVTVIPNAVNPDAFSCTRDIDKHLQDELDLSGKTVLGFIGSFYAYEGLVILLRALPEILKSAPDTIVLLVGGGPQERLLKQLAQELGIDKNVIFTGRVPHEDVKKYYDLVDMFIYPRLSMRLTELVTPLKPLEAMAQCSMVLASDVGGHKELIDSGVNGILFKADDIHALSTEVLKLISSRDSWGNIQQSGRKYVELQRNWEKSVENYKSVYSNAIKHHNNG